MSTNATPDETPKKTIAKTVVAAKRLYFFPASGTPAKSVEATSLEEAQTLIKDKPVKAGDE